MNKSNFLQQIIALQSAISVLGIAPETKLTTDELDFLSTRWLSGRNFSTGDPLHSTLEDSLHGLIKFRNNSYPCGCMGAAPGEPWCNCMIYANMDTYKLDIATYILEKDLELP
jgi:hypothetical protein